MMDRMVSLTIDGLEVKALAGSSIYQAATGAGIHIPTFCNHKQLVPVGACRMCLVEIEGQRGLQTSCTTPTRDGMVVRVHTSPAAVKARRANIEFLLTNHPLDCPVCDKGGECPLQNQALLAGPGQSRYIEDKRHKNKRYPLSGFIILDQERCVLCWRCVRFLDEWADEHELDLFGRGATTRIDTFPGRPLTSKWQGNTIDLCPVGALTSRVFRFESRVWELTNTSSVCPMCSVGCNTTLGVKTNVLRRVTPRDNPEVNDTWICDKGRFAHAFVDYPSRLTVPLVRRNGNLQPATWDEALDLIARRLAQVIHDEGPQAVAGLGSTRLTNEANYLLQRFMRTVVGTNNVDHLGRMPAGATLLSSLPMLEHKDVVLLLGCDPSTEAPLVELWIKKAVLHHGASVIAANPQRTELARYGGPWLGYRPGSEVALMNGLARAILDAGLASPAARATNMEELKVWLTPYGPKQVEEVTGVPAETLQMAARTLAAAQRPVVLYGPGWIQGPASLPNLGAVANLTLLLGGVEAGLVPEDNNCVGALDMGVCPDFFPGRQPVRDNNVRSRLASVWGSKLSPLDGLDFDGMMNGVREGSLVAMWIVGADPADDCRVASNALGAIPFLVVQDLFMTATASLAEVVLPAASFAEIDGSYTNLTGRIQALHAARRPPGQARPDWRIVIELARRMVGEKQRKAWDLAALSDVLAEMARLVPEYRGVDLRTAVGVTGWQRPAPSLATRRTFARVEASLPPHDPEYPLTLVAGRVFYDRGTLLRCSERVQRLVPDALVLIHPSDAAQLHLADGDPVSVVSAHGRLGFKVRVSDAIVPGVVFAPRNLSDAPLSVLYADRGPSAHVRLVK